MSDSLWPHGLQHARLPCPSLSPRVFSNSCPLNPWCYLITWPSGALFSLCLQSFPASGSFQMSWLFISGGQSIGASALTSVLPMTLQGWFPLEWTGLISLQSKELSRVFSSTTIEIINSSVLSLLYGPSLKSIHTTGKIIALTIWTFVGKVISLLFNMLSRFFMAFLPRSKHLLISWLWPPSAVILESKKIKYVSASTFSSLCLWCIWNSQNARQYWNQRKESILWRYKLFWLKREKVLKHIHPRMLCCCYKMNTNFLKIWNITSKNLINEIFYIACNHKNTKLGSTSAVCCKQTIKQTTLDSPLTKNMQISSINAKSKRKKDMKPFK